MEVLQYFLKFLLKKHKKTCLLQGGPVSSSAKTVAPVEASTSLNAGETVARNRGPNKQMAIASEIFWIPMILPSHGFQPHWMFLLKTKPQTSGVNKNWLCGWNRRIYGYLWMETRWKRSCNGSLIWVWVKIIEPIKHQRIGCLYNKIQGVNIGKIFESLDEKNKNNPTAPKIWVYQPKKR